jgi:hypothetical protein
MPCIYIIILVWTTDFDPRGSRIAKAGRSLARGHYMVHKGQAIVIYVGFGLTRKCYYEGGKPLIFPITLTECIEMRIVNYISH